MQEPPPQSRFGRAPQGASSGELKLRLHRPHAGQDILRAQAAHYKYVVAVLGRRWGKTEGGLSVAIDEALLRPPRSDYRALWVAPYYKTVRTAWNLWRTIVPPQLYRHNKSEGWIEVPSTGARITFRSAENPDSITGEGYDRVFVDEAARVSKLAWEQAILPTLADRGGKALLFTTPLGRKNWVHRLYLRARDPEFADYACIHGPSTENPNPNIKAFAQAMAPVSLGGHGEMDEMLYRQEFLAEFLEDEAAVFRGVRAAAKEELKIKSWKAARPDAMGLDVAKHRDWTVLTGVKRFSKRWRVVAWERFHRIPWPQQKARIKKAWTAAGGPPMAMDSTGVGDAIYDDLRHMGVRKLRGFLFTSGSKAQLVVGASTELESGGIEYPAELAVLIDELESFAYEISSQGVFRYGAPEGVHDDAVWSLLLALWAAKRSWQRIVEFD